jgi:hypothetical protein
MTEKQLKSGLRLSHRWVGLGAALLVIVTSVTGLLLQLTHHIDPHAHWSGRERDLLRFHEVEEVERLRSLTRQNHLRTHPGRGERNAPGIGVKHRYHREKRVSFANRKPVGEAQRRSV